MRNLLARLRRTDPRHFQIFALAALLSYGIGLLQLDVDPIQAIAILLTSLLVQYFGNRLTSDRPYDARSALISSGSLILLLRTSSLETAIAAALLAVGSKFVIRFRGRHIVNPTNFGIVVVLLLFNDAWVSPGLWGSVALTGAALMFIGFLVVQRAERSDITFVFLFSYAAILFGRALWYGDPMSIPLHQLQSGTLLIFAFFMISDPRTTPDARPARILYAVALALAAAWGRFALYEPTAVLYALILLSPVVPVLNIFFPGKRYEWPSRSDGTELKQSPPIVSATTAA